MSSDTSKITFQQLIDRGLLEISDGYRAKLSELGQGGPIFLRAGHLSDTEIDLEGVERFKGELTQRLASKLSRSQDTVVTTKGNSIGRTAYVTTDLPSFVYSPHLSYWRSLDHEKLVPGFLRYWARGKEFIAQLEGMKLSTDMAPYLSLRDQRRLQICLPSPGVQQGIADVLSALDNKIGLNLRMNRALEAMARAIFKSWFVDFDPVIAKAAGRQPIGMSRDSAALFPSRFVDSQEGAIPAGWRVGALKDIAAVNARAIRSGYPHETIQYVDIASVASGSLIATKEIALKKAPSRAQRLVAHGDTIWSCVRPNRRSYLLIQHPKPNLVVSTGFAVLSPKSNAASFVYLWTTSDEFVDYLTAHAEGSAYPAVRPDSFERASMLVPQESILASFEKTVSFLLEHYHWNQRQSATLASLRDILLPKLLSGEIRLRDAEKAVERAGA